MGETRNSVNGNPYKRKTSNHTEKYQEIYQEKQRSNERVNDKAEIRYLKKRIPYLKYIKYKFGVKYKFKFVKLKENLKDLRKDYASNEERE